MLEYWCDFPETVRKKLHCCPAHPPEFDDDRTKHFFIITIFMQAVSVVMQILSPMHDLLMIVWQYPLYPCIKQTPVKSEAWIQLVE